MSKDMKIRQMIGVLGGMGPAAAVDFMAKVIAATPAEKDQEHIPVILHNVPQIPDRSSAIMARDDSPFAPMLSGLMTLEDAGAKFLAIACNTAHHWYDRLAQECTRPILHIADCVKDEINRQKFKRVGLMASSGTILSGFYKARLGHLVEKLIIPDAVDQAEVDALIYETKAGEINAARAEACVMRLISEGAQIVVIACTDLPPALAGSKLSRCCVDATELLAKACVTASLGGLAS